MNITVFAAGSRGDIQPCIALCLGLRRAGHAARLAAPEDFADFARGYGIDFRPLRGDVQKAMASETGRGFMASGSLNPIASIKAMRALVSPIVKDMTEDAYAACVDADAIVCLGVLGPFGISIAESLGVPVGFVEPTPLLPTRAFPAASWPIQKDLGGLHNYLSGSAMLRVVWLWYEAFVAEFRSGLGLPRLGPKDYARALRSGPTVGAYSRHVIPRPADWPDSVCVAGYFFLEEPSGWQAPPELTAFLEAGDPPVYVGFGSMAGDDPERSCELVLEAIARSGRRGLILSGWGGLKAAKPSPDVLFLDSAPHGWLFPRMSAVVHHGGAGTTAEGVRAGLPSVILPFAFDQAFWGARLRAMGVGPSPIPQKRLSPAKLAEAIRIAAGDIAMRRRAGELGRAVREEEGVYTAVDFLCRRFEPRARNPGKGRP